jgi:integrase
MQHASSHDRRLVKTTTPGIYKRGGAYVVIFRDPNGRQRKRSARTLAEARDLKAALTADVRRGEYRALSKVTFAEYAVEWIGTYQGRTSRGIRPATLHDYRVRLGLDEEGTSTGRGAVSFFGQMRLSEVQPQDIRRFIAHTAARGIAANTIRLELAPVKALFATALEDGVVRSNPCAGVRIATVEQYDENGTPKVKAPRPDEYAAVLAALPDEWRLLFQFLGETGLRIGEAVALTWADIDFGACRLRVRRRWYRGSFGPPKSRYGRRAVPISADLARRLWAVRSDRRPDDGALVFVSENGHMLDQSNLSARILKPAARAAGVPWLSFHCFRHYCATELFRRGLNAKQVQVWLGHHSAAFTLSTYVHLLPDDLPESPFGMPSGGNKGATRATELDRNEKASEGLETADFSGGEILAETAARIS